MSAYKTILVHLDASPRSAMRLQLAAGLAERFHATASATFAATSAAMSAALALGEGTGRLAATAADLDAERRQRAREIFDQARPGSRVTWSALADPVAVPGFARAALAHDLMVLGQYDRSDAGGRIVPPDFAQAVIVESGRPALVVPHAGTFPDTGRNVLVAWKPTRETARAVAASLPLLRAADHVHVASWGDDPRELEPLLAAHGVDAQFHRESSAGARVGELMLSRAADFNADLLVMGCYGHSRARELVLGGATRTIMDSMTLPVLFTH